MFNLISTKNLYLVELVRVKKIERNKIWYYDDSKRYTLAKKESFFYYTDIFTHTRYNQKNYVSCGEECINNAKAIITDKRFLSKKELIYIMQELNPTYISQKTKKLKR